MLYLFYNCMIIFWIGSPAAFGSSNPDPRSVVHETFSRSPAFVKY
jgi:hypothetical protein